MDDTNILLYCDMNAGHPRNIVFGKYKQQLSLQGVMSTKTRVIQVKLMTISPLGVFKTCLGVDAGPA